MTNWKVMTDWQRKGCGVGLVIPAGTVLVSRDGGKTYRFKGMEALTVLWHDDVIALHQAGVLQKAE